MGSPVPPKKYFGALGLSQDVSEATVIITYYRLSEDRQNQVMPAYKILRTYHRMLAQNKTGEESSGRWAESVKKRRNDLVPRPPLRYFTSLGLGADASPKQVGDAIEILSNAIEGDKDEERLKASIKKASAVLQSYFRRLAEAATEANAEARGQVLAEAAAEAAGAAAEAEALAASFNGPAAVRRAYEKLGMTPGAFIDEVDVHLKMLLSSPDVARDLVQEYRAAAVMVTRYWDKAISDCVTVRQSSNKRKAEKSEEKATFHPLVADYMKTLRLDPGASLRQIEESYSMLQMDSNIDRVEKRRIDRACKFIVRFLKEAARREARQAMLVKAFRRVVVGSVIIVFLALLFWSFNAVRLRAMINSIEPGDELFDRNTNSYFGRVVAFEEEHQFRAGAPTPAFLVQMASTESEVWVSADFARKSLLVSNEDQ